MRTDTQILKNAKKIIALIDERNKLNEQEDYESAFEIECELRDIAAFLAMMIIDQEGKE